MDSDVGDGIREMKCFGRGDGEIIMGVYIGEWEGSDQQKR